jgi:hypothetical protein
MISFNKKWPNETKQKTSNPPFIIYTLAMSIMTPRNALFCHVDILWIKQWVMNLVKMAKCLFFIQLVVEAGHAHWLGAAMAVCKSGLYKKCAYVYYGVPMVILVLTDIYKYRYSLVKLMWQYVIVTDSYDGNRVRSPVFFRVSPISW